GQVERGEVYHEEAEPHADDEPDDNGDGVHSPGPGRGEDVLAGLAELGDERITHGEVEDELPETDVEVKPPGNKYERAVHNFHFHRANLLEHTSTFYHLFPNHAIVLRKSRFCRP